MPYREPGRCDAPERLADSAPVRDDAVLAALLLAVGGLRVALALAHGEDFGAEATIAAVMVVLGLVLAA